MVANGAATDLLNKTGVSPETSNHLTAAQRELGLDNALGLGVWIEVVPCNWDRSEPVEVLYPRFVFNDFVLQCIHFLWIFLFFCSRAPPSQETPF